MAFARTKAVGLGFKESRNYWGKVRSFTLTILFFTGVRRWDRLSDLIFRTYSSMARS